MTTRTAPKDAADLFGHKIAARLTEGQSDLPYVVTERLRASREQALSVRKHPAAMATRPHLQTATDSAVEWQLDGSATLKQLGSNGWTPQWLRTALTALPIAAMVAGIAFITVEQDFSVTTEVAELDTELLIDTLPPDAYTDQGFMQFLQSQRPSPVTN